ncbi:potassium channel family protein [Salibacterium qingdaonense]|uniref:Voltage-gated potassium channel n=1 Tax=Salibacterium qingdaonense TaxID=266892 RepID=A0A1I4LR13_9BACI|nr:potassium channel protein [Salibacterium qingdaonense]SFL93286.1 voltage-gated potassium channel [Salibacterium qingdaonense]
MHILKQIYEKVINIGNVSLFLFTLLFIAVSVLGILAIEPETFTVMSALWWVMTTSTTVGYGDISPVTAGGQWFTMLFVFPLGIGVIGVVISKILDSALHYKQAKEEGRLAFKDSNHAVFIGWADGKTESAVEEMLTNEKKQVVLIDRNLEKSPYQHERFHFIRGSATDESTLEKANILGARTVGIFAPQDINDLDLADGRTYLIASTIEAYGEKNSTAIYTIAELLSDKHEALFTRAGVNECIPSYQSVSNLIAKSMEYHGSSTFFMQLLSKQYGDDLHLILPKSSWTTYREARDALEQQGAILIANDTAFITDGWDDTIPPGTQLAVICSRDTYQHIK